MARTIVNLREDLLRKIKRLTGMTKKVEIVNLAMEQLIRQKEIEGILRLKGRIQWEGDLKTMRRNRLDFSR